MTWLQAKLAQKGTRQKAMSRKNRIESVQFLRFVAALLVVAYHLPKPSADLANTDFLPRALFQWGGFGVDIFFVISGFIICYTASKREIFERRSFLLDRADRIFPTYWVLLSLVVAVSLAQTAIGMENDRAASLTLVGFVTSILLLPLPYQIMQVAWTLGMEIVFYLIFALTYHAWRLKGVVVALLIWYGLSLVYQQITENSSGRLFVFLLHTVCLEFLYGVGIATLYLRGKMPLGLPVLLLGVLSMIVVSTGWVETPLPSLNREFSSGIPAAMIVYGSAALAYRVPRWTVLAGEASYALYLSHVLAIAIASHATAIIFDTKLGDSFMLQALTLASCVIVSIVILFVIERPLRGLLKHGPFAKRPAGRTLS